MKPVIRAVIDIGTNSVKLLVADVSGKEVVPLLEESEQTRLGRGFYETHRLQSAAIEETARVVTEFAERAAQFPGVVPQLIATSAARDAVNGGELKAAIRQRCQLDVEIISGDQEAEWVFRGVATDPVLAGRRMLIMDVGGGSTEFILGEGGHHSFCQSFPMGSVRLMETLRPDDPPSISDMAACRAWLTEFFDEHITRAVESFLQPQDERPTTLVGTGGTATILARMAGRLTHFNRDEIEGMQLRRAQVLDMMVHLWSVSLAERKKITGIPGKRADIILMGVAIFEAVMEHFRADELYVSTRGLRFGVVAGGARL